MRDIALDNFKFVLIALVIIGHVIEPVIRQLELAKSIYIFIYLFHIPMFAYASGAVSSKGISGPEINKIVRKLILPYILLEIIYSLFDFYLFSRTNLTITLLVPYWILWYLFSLILWRLMLPIFDEFKFPVIVAVIAGFASGLTELGYSLSFSRTFVFFPFFLIGYYYHSLIIAKIHKCKSHRLVGGAIIFTFFIGVLFIPDSHNIELGWLYGSRPYSWLNVDWHYGFMYRLALYIVSIALGISLLAIVKKTRGFYTDYGKRSLYIYVLHGFVMKGLIAFGFYKYINEDYKVISLAVLSIILLPILSSNAVIYIVNNMTNLLSGMVKENTSNKALNGK